MKVLGKGTKLYNNSYEVIKTVEKSSQYISYLCSNKLDKIFFIKGFLDSNKQELVEKYKSEIDSNKIMDIFEENSIAYVVYEHIENNDDATVKVSKPDESKSIQASKTNKLIFILPIIILLIGIIYFTSNSQKNEIESLYYEARNQNTIDAYVKFKDVVLNNYDYEDSKDYLDEVSFQINKLAKNEIENKYNDLTYSLEDCKSFRNFIDNYEYLDKDTIDKYKQIYQETYYNHLEKYFDKNRYSYDLSTLNTIQNKLYSYKQCLPLYTNQLKNMSSKLDKKISKLEYRSYKIKINYIEIRNPSKWDSVSSSGKKKYPDLMVKIIVDNSIYYSDGTWKNVSSRYFDIVSKTFRAKSDTKVSIEIYDDDSGSQIATAILTQILFDKSMDTGGVQTVGKWYGTVGDLIDDNDGKLSFDGISSLQFEIY